MLPFPCAVIIHIRFIGYDLSRTVRLSTPNSVTKINTVFRFSKQMSEIIPIRVRHRPEECLWEEFAAVPDDMAAGGKGG